MKEAAGKTSSGNAFIGRAELVVLVVAIAVFLVTALILTPFTPDDAYISYRYAENLAGGKGLVFNAGDRPVEGYSNLLWLLISALAHKTGLTLPSAMPTIGAYLGVLGILVLWLLYLRRRMPAFQLLIPMLLFASSAPFVLYSASGMETGLFAALLLFAILFFEKAASSANASSWILLAVTCLLLTLCRPEGVLVMPVIVAYLAAADRSALKQKPSVLAAAVFVVGVVLYQIWRVNYFGEWAPRALWVSSDGGLSIRVWIENLRMYFVTQGADFAPMGYYYAALAVLAAIGISLSSGSGAARHGERLALVTVAVYAIVYLSFVDPFPGMRYHAPLIGLLFLPVVHVPGNLVKNATFRAEKKHAVQYGIIVLALLALSYGWVADLKMMAARVEEGNQACSAALGTWLREYEESDAVLATTDLGAIPYYSEMKTLDIGRIPLTAQPGRGRVTARYLLDRNPDVVLLVSYGQFTGEFGDDYAVIAESREFLSRYRVRGAVRYDMFKDRSFWVYELREIKHTETELDSFPFGMSTVRRVNPDQ